MRSGSAVRECRRTHGRLVSLENQVLVFILVFALIQCLQLHARVPWRAGSDSRGGAGPRAKNPEPPGERIRKPTPAVPTTIAACARRICRGSTTIGVSGPPALHPEAGHSRESGAGTEPAESSLERRALSGLPCVRGVFRDPVFLSGRSFPGGLLPSGAKGSTPTRERSRHAPPRRSSRIGISRDSRRARGGLRRPRSGERLTPRPANRAPPRSRSRGDGRSQP